ncbi:Ig-like domain-containing protein [Lacrimispora saccharolytica]|nr:Ig-like domain-containing protein [Lacrimispora saccharolytica]
MRKNLKTLAAALVMTAAVTGMVPQTTTIEPFSVTAEAAAVKLSKSKAGLTIGQELDLELKGYSGAVKWSSSNKKVATVNKNGLVKAKKKGSTVITAKAGKKKYKCKITVKALKVKSLKLNEQKLVLKKDNKEKLKAIVSPANASNKTVTWKSSNKKVATVNSKGVVTAKKNGTAIITATAKDGSKKKATCKVTVLKGTGYVTLEERYADEEKRLNIPINDAGNTWGFDKGNGNLIPLKLKVGETTVVEYLGTLGHRGIHQYEWTLEDQVSNVIDPNSGYVDVKQIGNKFFITPLKEGMYEIHVLENTIPESSGFNRNYHCYFETENPGKYYSRQPQIGEKYYKRYHHLDSPVYTVKSQYQDGSFAFACEESTTGNIVRMHSYELEPVSMWE